MTISPLIKPSGNSSSGSIKIFQFKSFFKSFKVIGLICLGEPQIYF